MEKIKDFEDMIDIEDMLDINNIPEDTNSSTDNTEPELPGDENYESFLMPEIGRAHV